MKNFLVLIAGLLMPVAAIAQAASPSTLFRSLTGSWDCAGGFPNGRTLAADLTFTPALEGRLLRFNHSDRAPSAYWQEATWLFDAANKRVMSLSASGSTKNTNVGAALFVATQWTDSSVTLEADSLKGPPWTPNRFSYTLRDSAKMTMRWETARKGTWVLGDSLVCGRRK